MNFAKKFQLVRIHKKIQILSLSQELKHLLLDGDWKKLLKELKHINKLVLMLS
jgi:hypothetical protein